MALIIFPMNMPIVLSDNRCEEKNLIIEFHELGLGRLRKIRVFQMMTSSRCFLEVVSTDVIECYLGKDVGINTFYVVLSL